MIHKDNLISIKFKVANRKPYTILNKENNFNVTDDIAVENTIGGDIIMEFNDITISLIEHSSTPIELSWFSDHKMKLLGIGDNAYYLKDETKDTIALYFNDEKIGQYKHGEL